MPPVARLDPRTASAAQSIWRDVSEDEFRKQIVALYRGLGEIPADPKIHSAAVWQEKVARYDSHHRLLPLRVEHRLADDLAFVAAAKEDPKAVSAAVVEESPDSSGLTIRLAANDGIRPEVADTFRAICQILSRCASKHLSRQSCANALFDSVITLCEYRIHGRLESSHWTRPRHQPNQKKKPRPLHQALRKYCLRLKSVGSNASKSVESLRDRLMGLCSTYDDVDRFSEEPSKRAAAIKMAVQQSYEICTSGGKCSISTTIAAHGLDSGQICKERVIRQVNKIGRYWGLCVDMAEDSRRYSILFKDVSLDCLAPYTKASSRVHGNAITNDFVKCRIHAEIQLLVYLDQREQSEFVRPRVIGVNKAACYLCNLFFLTHGKYFITKTHGRLYEQWTLPDLKTFHELQRRQYRRIIATMTEVLKTAIKGQPKQKRVDPMQSYVCLPTPSNRSPLPSYAGTIISDAASNSAKPPTHNTLIPRASPINLANAPQVKISLTPSVQPFPVQTSPAAPDRSVKHPESRSRTPSAPGSSISSLASLSAYSDSSPKPLHTIPLQPSSRLPSPTESSSRTDSQRDLVPTHASQVPRNTAKPHDPSPSSSSCTIALHPLHLSLTRTITTTHPLRLSCPGLYVTIEMDGSGSGKARILNPEAGDEISAAVIDVDNLKPGESMTLEKKEGAPCLALLLCPRKRAEREGLGCQLELNWVL